MGRLKSSVIFAVLASRFLLSQPSTASEGVVHTRGADLYYHSIGSGEPIVVLHGGPGLDHTYLQPQLNALAKNFKLIYYDQRATGRSSGTVDSVSITPDQFVEDLEGVRKAFDIEKMNLLGHSWGGLLAMHYGIRYPQHLKSVILVDAAGASSGFLGPFVQTRTDRTTHQDSLDLAMVVTSEGFKHASPHAVGEFLRIVFRTYFADRRYVDSLHLDVGERTARNCLPIMAMMFSIPYDLRPQLAIITCPVLIVHGDYDPVVPKFAEEIRDRLPHARYVLIKNCGHFSYIEARTEFLQAVNGFLSQL